MHTRTMMTFSAAVLAALGMALTFLPAELAAFLGSEPDPLSVLVLQVVGALYMGMAMLNWMAKGGLMGGIYNRPICIANLTHFFIGGMALLKFLLRHPEQPVILWGLCAGREKLPHRCSLGIQTPHKKAGCRHSLPDPLLPVSQFPGF